MVELVFTGGLRWYWGVGLINLPWPTVRLILNDSGIRVEPSSPLVKLLVFPFGGLPTIPSTWSQVSRAEFCRGSRFLFSSPGVRIRFLQTDRPIIFWARNEETARQILDHFRQHGVEVGTDPHRVGLLGL
jgi:hypothetical protein